jgi:hypothetical protein
MYKMMKFLIAILFLGFYSCKEVKPLKTIPLVDNKENNFFETIDSVRLISFPSKMYWDKKEIMSEKDVDFEIPNDKIIDNLTLNKEELDEIVEILKIDYKNECMEADCYEPRHMLQFYKNDEIIAFYEICLECGGHQNSKNLDFLPPFCLQKGEELKQVFIKMKLKNSGEGSSILDKLEN